jgi:hypothetical protein
MQWDVDRGYDLPDSRLDADATIRPSLLPADDDPLRAARGCVLALTFALPCWILLAIGLVALGWLIAGVRFP